MLARRPVVSFSFMQVVTRAGCGLDRVTRRLFQWPRPSNAIINYVKFDAMSVMSWSPLEGVKMEVRRNRSLLWCDHPGIWSGGITRHELSAHIPRKNWLFLWCVVIAEATQSLSGERLRFLARVVNARSR